MTTSATGAVRINLPSLVAEIDFGPFFTDIGCAVPESRRIMELTARDDTGRPRQNAHLGRPMAQRTEVRPFERIRGPRTGRPGRRPGNSGAVQEIRCTPQPRRAAGDATAWFFRVQTAIMAAAADTVIATTVDHADAMTIGTLVNTETDDPLSPGRSCHAVIFDRKLMFRSKLPQVLIGFDQDPQLLTDIATAAGAPARARASAP